MSNFDALVTKLREIFQIDRPELDFGVYRILNARAGEIDAYLTTRLKEQVAEAFTAGAAANTDALAKELTDKIAQYEADGVNPDTVPAVQKLREAIAAATTGASEHENQVFSHLLTFFSRYYDKGDFISQRRYKGDTYAIPYSGEEVVLHWANKDQYYTKSGEAFSNYGFKLEDGRSVQFRLVAADTAKDNRKDNDKERRFVLAEARTVTRIDEDGETYEDAIVPIREEDGNLVIRFDYKAVPKGSKQDALVDQAVAAVLADETVKARWLALTERAPTDKNPQRTLLEKCLTNYTQKNSVDYFIHKNLGGFLRRELDFFIKNEVMNLDDVQNAAAFGAIEKNLRMIQCLRAIALHLITFLASIEDFQKKLWLKKKFVVAAHYCVTLDRVPEELYPAIAANPAQWAQWHDLGMRDSAQAGNVVDLKASPYLMVDTALFDAAFRANLLKSIPDLDASTDGLLVHGDNFQALTLLSESYQQQVKCVYIDPPYNTGADDFAYKDRYQHSSWLTAISDRLNVARRFLKPSSFFQMSISDIELLRGRLLLEGVFGESSVKTIAVKMATASGVKMASASSKGTIPKLKEYLVVASNGPFSGYFVPKIDKAEWDDEYRWYVDGLNDEELAAIKSGVSDPESDFTIDVLDGLASKLRLRPVGDVIRERSIERKDVKQWKFDNADRIVQTVAVTPSLRNQVAAKSLNCPHEYLVVETSRGNRYLTKRADADAAARPRLQLSFAADYLQTHPGDFWQDISTTGLDNEGGVDFKNGKKPIKLINRALTAARIDGEVVLDFFAGSGTSVESVIGTWSPENVRAKVVAVEGDHQTFRDKLTVRSKLAVAKGKKSAALKILNIESYEDTLNNLNLRRDERQGALLDAMSDQARDDYLMRYMLDVEARGSLLSVEDFRKPFDYTLNIAVDSAGAYEPRKVDLVETFNYLIGLTVRHIDIQLKQGFVTVEGTLPTGEKTLVLWRDCDVLDYDGLTRLCDKLAINPADSEYEVVYLNGDHNIPSVLTTSEAEGEVTKVLKLRQIEPAFLSAMFDVADV